MTPLWLTYGIGRFSRILSLSCLIVDTNRGATQNKLFLCNPPNGQHHLLKMQIGFWILYVYLPVSKCVCVERCCTGSIFHRQSPVDPKITFYLVSQTKKQLQKLNSICSLRLANTASTYQASTVYPIFFKCRNAVDLSMLSLSATSSVEIRELFCTKLRTCYHLCQKIKAWFIVKMEIITSKFHKLFLNSSNCCTSPSWEFFTTVPTIIPFRISTLKKHIPLMQLFLLHFQNFAHIFTT